MSLSFPNLSIAEGVPARALVIVAILVLGLLGGLFRHHESASDSAACAFCHAGVQTPVPDLAGTLFATGAAVVGFIPPVLPSRLPGVAHFSTLIPRGPPVATHPVMFREGCMGVV